ncbi:MAG TPA: methylated-DNA--[protein]-cysteine S-methyltransferase [Candidatus Fraserbacteria bacterium]|nr:methylated-DNA--[protein]-cysteine S-methyltransferase [Candidatus Fraserbacteria bacterium]
MTDGESVYYICAELPPGPMLIAATERGLCRLTLPGEDQDGFWSWLKRRWPAGRLCDDPGYFRSVVAALEAYFQGELRRFDLRLDLCATPFQRRVLREISAIPYGETSSYGRLAARLGQPHAARAVGAATGSNPLPIVIPCHRVIGAEGQLVGYGGGLALKVKLLRLEGHRIEGNKLIS